MSGLERQPRLPLRKRLRQLLDDRAGVVAVIFALMTPMLLAGVGFAVDGALMYTARNRLQVAADAAALAGVAQLARGGATAAAQSFADANVGAGALAASDVISGKWDAGAKRFSAGGGAPNALQVTTRFAAANGNPHRLVFGGALGFGEMDISARAIAMTTGGLTCSGNVVLFKDPTFVPSANARSVNTLGGPCGSPCPAGFKGPNGHVQTPEGNPVLRLDVGASTFAANPSQTLTVRSGSTINERYTLPGPGRWFVVATIFTNPYDINDPGTKTKPKTVIVYSNFGSGTATWSNDIRQVMSFTQPAQCPANATVVSSSGDARLVG